jgi:cyclic pyranopterin phosphate synthase
MGPALSSPTEPASAAVQTTAKGPAGGVDLDLLVDAHGRVLRDLRISVTDRCNFRCLYCLPETEAAQNFYRGRWGTMPVSKPIVREWAPKSHLLNFEEIERAARLALDMGIQKLRLTGGEPLLRRNLPDLVARLSRLKGLEDLALTTNGFSFTQHAQALRDAGLHRVSFSLDSLDRENFKKVTGRDALKEVLQSIESAQALGFDPVKVNAVIIRGINDHEIEALAAFGQERGLHMRYIEFMPLDSRRAWQRELVVTGAEIRRRIEAMTPLEAVASSNRSETARRWRMPGGRGEIGIVAPVSEPFCGHCNRLRLTADGQVRTCLFSVREHDLRKQMREGAPDAALRDWLRAVVLQKEARHHIGEREFQPPDRSMSCIGG